MAKDLSIDMKNASEVSRIVGQLYPAVYRRFHRGSQYVSGTDLTPRMVIALRHLLVSGPLTVTEAAAHFSIGKAATTELISRLQKRGYVSRMPDQRDRRRVFIWLTDEGRSLAQRLGEVLGDDELEAAVHRMSVAERQALISGLQALLQAGKDQHE